MEAFAIGGAMFLIVAVIGLLLLVTGIVFVIKSIEIHAHNEIHPENDGRRQVIGNIVGIVLFSFMIFFGAIWLICFGIGAVTFFIISAI